MKKIEDTYFDSFSKALEVAKEQNVNSFYSQLQICYYDGNKEIETEYKNLIYLPSNEIVEKLFLLNTRLPTKILSPKKVQIQKELELFQKEKNIRFDNLKESIKDIKLNFDEPLRVLISSTYGSLVVTDVYKMLQETFEYNGYKVYFDINDNITIMDDFRIATSVYNFKPHLTIAINRIRNHLVSDDMFCFTWFQDETLCLFDDSKILCRERDYFFYLEDGMKKALLDKNVPLEKLFYQTLALNNKYFYLKDQFTRENKVLFIGSNYFELNNSVFKEYKDKHNIINELLTGFNKNTMTRDILDELALKYKATNEIRSLEHLSVFIYGALVRLETVKWICTQSEIPVEVYGSGWENVDEVKPFYKGVLKYGSDIADAYHKAKYCLVANPQVYYQQRTFESSACGAIPIVYESKTMTEEFHHRDNVLLFHDKQSLYNCIGKEPIESPFKIVENSNYNDFIEKMVQLTKENSNNRENR